jgi:predicted RNase H-like HicB family nuclease
VTRSLTVIMERDPDGGFIASVPELPGCHSQGDSIEELRTNIREAIALYLEGEELGELPEFVGLERIEA